jgi:hypothetical protein
MNLLVPLSPAAAAALPAPSPQRAIAPMSEQAIDLVRRMEAVVREMPQAPFKLDRDLHEGMYARTVTLPPGYWGGTIVNEATFVIVVGEGEFYVGTDEPLRCSGVTVIKAAGRRKQAFLAHTHVTVTAISIVGAATVDEADAIMSGEPELLREGC